MAEKTQRFTFQIHNRNRQDKLSWKEKHEKKVIKNGNDNLFPQNLIELYNKSSVHAACVNAIVEGVTANGLTANEEIYIERANAHGESWNDIFEKVALDYKLHGSFALEIIYSNDRSRIDVYHIDYSNVRAAKKDYRGHIPGYFISTDWKKNYTYSGKIEESEDVMYLPTFNPELKTEEPHQIYVLRNYRPGQEYYSLPDYIAAHAIITLDCSIDDFHVSNINNGLAPSLAITTFTNGSDDQLTSIEQQLNANYGGTSNAGSLMFMDVANKDEAPIITPINPSTTDNYYTAINDLVMQKLLTAHRITSPLLLGIQQPGTLGNRDEMIDAMTLFQRNVLTPYQQDLLKVFEELIQFNYPDAVLGIDTTRLFEDGTEKEEVVVDAETTDAQEDQITDQQPELIA